jgi:predicted GIY-YIG superfamily endonuclease
VYSIPCEHDKVYVGQTARITEIRCQEHIRHPCHGQTEKLTVVEYLPNTGHEIQFEKTHRLDKTTTYMDQTMK